MSPLDRIMKSLLQLYSSFARYIALYVMYMVLLFTPIMLIHDTKSLNPICLVTFFITTLLLPLLLEQY